MTPIVCRKSWDNWTIILDKYTRLLITSTLYTSSRILRPKVSSKTVLIIFTWELESLSHFNGVKVCILSHCQWDTDGYSHSSKTHTRNSPVPILLWADDKTASNPQWLKRSAWMYLIMIATHIAYLFCITTSIPTKRPVPCKSLKKA